MKKTPILPDQYAARPEHIRVYLQAIYDNGIDIALLRAGKMPSIEFVQRSTKMKQKIVTVFIAENV
ncbi:MAG TPA: hypothetical protein VHO84_02580 [Syntrophorhabdaceae bacterium]|nr:hypothetical protein [Syntrophorhabdaceae bacterium]